MRLLVDIGNTRVKWARDAGSGRLQTGESFPSAATALPAALDRHWGRIERPSAVLVCNVTGPLMEQRLADWCRARWALLPQWICSAPTGHGIVNAYPDPARMGADRWVAMIGARALVGLPVCVVDLGTAVTVDLVDGEGRHRGGLIAPGVALMKESLLRRARGVQPGPATGPREFWGRDTGAGLASGVLQMTAGLIERAARQAALDLGRAPVLVLTGGNAPMVAPCLSAGHELVPDLVLQGLACCG